MTALLFLKHRLRKSEGVAEFFHKLGFKVGVVNLSLIKSFRYSKLIRQKTNSVDARVIAEFCLQNDPDPWKPKSPEQKELHGVIVRIEALKKTLNRTSNALENKNLSKVVLESIHNEEEFLEEKIDLLENEAQKIINSNSNLSEQFDRIIDIKGVGEKLATAIKVSKARNHLILGSCSSSNIKTHVRVFRSPFRFKRRSKQKNLVAEVRKSEKNISIFGFDTDPII